MIVTGYPTIDFGSISIPGGSGSRAGPSSGASVQPGAPSGLPEDPATLREMLLSSPHDLALLKERNPPLADALLSGDLGRLPETSDSSRVQMHLSLITS